MPVQYPEIKKFLGLHLQANSFTVPDGALEVADNVVITKDDRILSRRGFYEWNDSGADVFNSIFNYQNRLIGVFTDKVKYFTESGTDPNKIGTGTTITGATVAVTNGRVARFVESNNNLYFTSDNGPLKLENFNSVVSKVGAPPALDLRARFLPENGPIGGNSQSAWRIVFGKRDANANLILSAPSDVIVLTNSQFQDITWTRAANVVTVTNPNHNLVTGMTITVVSSTGTAPVVAGIYVITGYTATTFTFSSTAANDTALLVYNVSRTARLEFSIPSEITSTTEGYFYQIYRSTQSSSDIASPQPDYKLSDEQVLTAGDITARVIFYDDDVDDILLGAELYTNPNSREGELQANERPPLCDDMTIFKNYVLYGSCTTRHLLSVAVIDPSVMVSGDYIEIKVGAVTRRYVSRTGVGNNTVSAESVAGTGTITITYGSHGLVNGDTVYISQVTGTLPVGTYTISGVTANTFDVTSVGNSATVISFQGITNGTYPIFQLDNSSGSISVRLRSTSQGLVKAINRDTSSLVYAKYTSGISDVPGKFRLQAKGFTDPIYMRANSTTAGEAFSPVLPDSFASGTQVFSKNDTQPNTFYASKLGEPEAVPIVNNFPVGPRNKTIFRTIALRDTVIHLTASGVYRTVGDTPANFVTTVLDSTVICQAPASAVVLNNQVVFLSNQGVCLVTESAVQIISRKIEDVIQPILSISTLAAQTFGIAYESERLYLLSTFKPNESTASTVYAYNILNETWTNWDTVFSGGCVGPLDTLYLITNTDKIAKERKFNTRIDYSDQNFALTVVSVAVDKKSAVIDIPLAVPEKGDMIVKNNVITRINSATLVAGIQYTVTFARETNLVAADALFLYGSILSVIKPAPFHAGKVGVSKQFSQMQIHLREPAMSRLTISYTGYTYGGSEEIEWNSVLVNSGWGFDAWGFFPWGQEDGVNLTFGTQPAPVVRTYIPRFQQRSTFIQPVLTHHEAGEPLNIQAIAFAVRAYMERVSK